MVACTELMNGNDTSSLLYGMSGFSSPDDVQRRRGSLTPNNIRPMMEDDEEEVEHTRSSWDPNWAGPWHVAAGCNSTTQSLTAMGICLL